jgi:uncharacterized protein
MREVSRDFLEEKHETLKARLGDLRRVAVLFSGGLDSTLLAFVAFSVLGEDAAALTVDSPLMSPDELEDARTEARRIGIPFHILEDPLRDDVRMNPPDRCFFCRKARHEKAREWADRNGFPFLLDGANTTDLGDYRPGFRAAEEDGILHPLLEAGLTKQDVRELTRRQGLPGWDRPSNPCAGTRFPYGFAFTEEDVLRVTTAERFLRGLGLPDVRVRVFPPGAAIVETSEPGRAFECRAEILAELTRIGYPVVSLDLEGFSGGKMNRFLDRSTREKDQLTKFSGIL